MAQNFQSRFGMNITIVCGHFLPAMGYIEVHLARAFAEIGHQVTVVTTDAIPPYVSNLHQEFGQPPRGVEVKRLKPIFTLGQVAIAKGVKEAVLNSKPDQIIIIGLGKNFPKPALGLGIHTTALFGDNAASYGDSPSGKTKLLFEIFKRGTYQKAISTADRLVAYTPESFEAAGKMLGGKWADKLRDQKEFISLGFDPKEFYFDENLREVKRAELGFSGADRIVITATRIRPEKSLESAIPAFQKASSNTKWLLLGGAEDEYAKQLEERLKKDLGEDRFILLPHQKRADINALYNAADMALFTTPAISIIEAMGSGLPAILPEVKSLSHLIRDSDQGQVVSAFSYLDIQKISLSNREERAKKNANLFSWQRQAKSLLVKR
jgi:glycosyltransferase involved in cell wall biosynthesis